MHGDDQTGRGRAIQARIRGLRADLISSKSPGEWVNAVNSRLLGDCRLLSDWMGPQDLTHLKRKQLCETVAMEIHRTTKCNNSYTVRGIEAGPRPTYEPSDANAVNPIRNKHQLPLSNAVVKVNSVGSSSAAFISNVRSILGYGNLPAAD